VRTHPSALHQSRISVGAPHAHVTTLRSQLIAQAAVVTARLQRSQQRSSAAKRVETVLPPAGP
jgi:hypothetical protein